MFLFKFLEPSNYNCFYRILNTCIGNKHNDVTEKWYIMLWTKTLHANRKSQCLQFKVDSSKYITSMYNHFVFRACKLNLVCHNWMSYQFPQVRDIPGCPLLNHKRAPKFLLWVFYGLLFSLFVRSHLILIFEIYNNLHRYFHINVLSKLFIKD